MGKIFGLGVGRTGSKSLAKAMVILGYKAKHCISYIDEVYKFEFINDQFIASRYEFLDFCFPNSKFILTVRDLESWIISARNWAKGKGGYISKDGGTKIPLRRAEARFMMYKTTYFDEDKFRIAYKRYYKNVFKYFKGRKEDLLVLNVCAGEGWKKLCKFLNKPIPDIPFPHRQPSEKRGIFVNENKKVVF